MSETFLYLTTTGRTTGLPRQIEIWFVEHQGKYYVVSEMRERSGWVRNLAKTPAVSFSVGTRESQESRRTTTAAAARIVTKDVEPELVAAVSKRMDEKYGWSDGLVVELAPFAK